MKPAILLVFCLSLLPLFGQEEMLRNPDFTQPFDAETNWKVVLHKEYRDANATPATIMRQGGKPYVQAQVDITSAGSYYNIHQPVECRNDVAYRLTFEARTLGEGGIGITLMDPEKKANAGMAAKPKTDKTWRRFEVLFKPKRVSTERTPVLYVTFGKAKGISHVRDFSLKKTDKEVGRTTISETPPPGTVPGVDLPELLAEFEADPAGAGAKYKDQAVQLSAPVTAVTRGPAAGSYVFTLAFGKVKLIGNGAELGGETLQQLAGALKAGNAKAAAMQRSSKWERFTPEERRGHMASAYPTLHAGAFISGYSGGVLQCGRSQDLAVTMP